MSNTVNNNIPFVPENTIDPAAGLNESLNIIDMLLQLAVLTVNGNTPPASPAEGDRHIVGPAPTGAWSGMAGLLARYLDGYWNFLPARTALNLADGILYVRRTTTWSATAGGAAWGGITGTLSAQADLQAALDAKLATIQKGAANGVATLGADGKIPVSQLPPLAVNEVFTVASQAAMLALTAERGDVAIRTDLGGQAFILSVDAPGTLANWISLQQALSVALAALNALTPAADRLPYFDSTSTAALAVFTAQARLLLAAATQAAQKVVLGLDLVSNTADANKQVSGPQQVALDTKVGKTGDETVAGLKVFMNQLYVQSGAAAGTLVLGADVNNNTLTDGVRKLGGFAARPLMLANPNWTVLVGDTTEVAGSNIVYIGGRPFSSIGSATSIQLYTSTDQLSGSGTLKWSVGSTGHIIPGAASVYDIGSTALPIRSLIAGSPIRPGLYTAATRPTASAWTNYIISVSDGLGGAPRLEQSNGTAWVPVNAGAWTNLTLSAGFTAGASPAQFRYIDDEIQFRGKIVITAALGMGATRQFCAMAAGLRPSWLASDTDPLRLPILNVTTGVGGHYLNALRTGVFSVGTSVGLAAGDILDLSTIRYQLA